MRVACLIFILLIHAASSPAADDASLTPVPNVPSETWRITRRGTIVGEVGTTVIPIPSAGLTASMYAKPDILAEMNYSHGVIPLYVFKAYSDVLALRAKTFWGNSFYTNTGLARRTLGASLSPSPLIGTSVFDARAEITEVVAEIGIGNMWQWEHFTLGFDWLGVMLPIARVGSRDDFPNSTLSDLARQRKDEFIGDVAGGRSYEGMRLAFGYSF